MKRMQVLSVLSVVCQIGLSTAFGATYRLWEGTGLQSYELAEEEVLVSRVGSYGREAAARESRLRGGGVVLRDLVGKSVMRVPVAIDPVAAARGEEGAQAEGVEIQPVLYPKGGTRSPEFGAYATKEVLVHLKQGQTADGLALAVGASGVRPAPMAGWVYLRFENPWRALEVSSELQQRGEEAAPVVQRVLQKFGEPSDDQFGNQWHLRNVGQGGGAPGVDANVVSAWDISKGAGVTMVVVDDSVQVSHPDLKGVGAVQTPALGTNMHRNFLGGVLGINDPTPQTFFESHGTAVAGVALARQNNQVDVFNAQGVTGSGPETNLLGIRIIGGPATDEDFATALTWNPAGLNASISSNSWGFGGAPGLRSFGPIMDLALAKAAQEGRALELAVTNTLGSPVLTVASSTADLSVGMPVLGTGVAPGSVVTEINPPAVTLSAPTVGAVTSAKFVRGQVTVFANGNSKLQNDNGNYQQMQKSRFVIAVGAIDNTGVQSFYSTPGANLLISAPSNGGSLGIFTTDNFNLADAPGYNPGEGEPAQQGYTNSFGGTSSATPLVSGGVAVMLGANPRLGWRDVCEILAQTAVKVDADDEGWALNGAGFHFNHRYGAGMIDITTAATLALDWKNLGAEISLSRTAASLPVSIPDDDTSGVSRTFDFSSSPNMRVERVTVTALIQHARRSDLQVELISPSGMRSILAETHPVPSPETDPNIDYREGSSGWVFSTTQHLGENSSGTWEVEVKDLSAGTLGSLQSCEVTLFGSGASTAGQRVGFAAQRSTVLEGAGSMANVVVNRLGGSAGSAQVTCVLGGFNGGANQTFSKTGVDPLNTPESAVLTLPSTSGLAVGMLVQGDGIRPGSRIISIDSPNNRVTLSRPTEKEVILFTVNPHSLDSAIEGVDFTASYSQTVSFADGESSKTISIPVTNDSIAEDNRVFYLILKDPTNAALGGNAIHRVEILDDDSNRVTIRAGDSSISESTGTANPGSFIVSRPFASGSPLTVNLSATTGTATAGEDYDSLPSTVTIEAGAIEAVVPVTVREDNLEEGTETIILALAPSAGVYEIGTPGTATLNLRDNDLPNISIETSGAFQTITEARMVTGIVNLSGNAVLSVPVEGLQFALSDLAGMSVSGTGIPVGATVLSVSDSSVTISAPTTQAVTAARFYKPGKFTIKRVKGSGVDAVESLFAQNTVVRFNPLSGSAVSGTHYDAIASTLVIPGFGLTQCATTLGSTVVNCASTSGLEVGMTVAGLGVLNGQAQVVSVSPTQFTMSAASNATLETVNLTNCIADAEGFTITCTSTTGLRSGMVLSGTGLASGTVVVEVLTGGTQFTVNKKPTTLPVAPGINLTASVTLLAGRTSVDVLIVPKDDAEYSGTLSVVASIAEDATYTVDGLKSSATVSIQDNDRQPDRKKPTLTISTPRSGQKFTQAQVLVGVQAAGGAVDNAKNLKSVVYRVNTFPPHVLPVASLSLNGNLYSWSANITAEVVPGANTLSVYSEDNDGNQSPLSVRTFFYSKQRLLTVNLEVNGSPATSTSGVSVDRGYLPSSQRDANVNYRITASSKSDMVFSGWSGLVNSNSRTLNFVMPDSDSTLTAKFVTNPFTAEISGTYAGLVQKSVGFSFNSTGFLSATVTPGGACSGRLTLGRLKYPNSGATSPVVSTVSYPFKGEFVAGVPASGQATLSVQIPRKDARDTLNLSLVLDLNPAGTRRITGSVTGTDAGPGAGTTPLNGAVLADRAHYSKLQPYSAPGKPYTFIVPPRSITTTSLATLSGSVLTLTGADTAQILGIRQSAYVTGTNIPLRTTVTAISADGRQLTLSLTPTGNPTSDLAFSNPTEPTGYGYGTATVDTLGRVSLTGKLADGSRFSKITAALSKDNTWPLYLSLYGGKGVFLGQSVVVAASDSDMKTTGIWYKAPTGLDLNLLPNGFGPFSQTLLAATYTAPSTSGVPWVIAGQATANPVGAVEVAFTKGSLKNLEFSADVRLSELKNKTVFVGEPSALQGQENPKKVSFTVTPTTGLFTGRFVHPEWPATVGYEGVFYQKANRGYGAFLAPKTPVGKTGIREIGSVEVKPN